MTTPASYNLEELLLQQSNTPFSSQIESHIHSLVLESQTDANQLESKISQARTLLDDLYAKHSRVTRHLSILRSAISPLKKVPVEILDEIFVLCGDGLPVALPPSRFTKDRYPWNLGRVCSRWRKVLQASLDVWRNLAVDPTTSSADLIIRFVNDILSRVPGGLHLSTQGYIDVNNPIGVYILDVADKLQSLSMKPTQAFLDAFLALPSNFIGILKSIEIEVTQVSIPVMTVTSLSTSPNLANVVFRGSSIIPEPHSLGVPVLPWGQLTAIMFDRLTLTCHEAHTILNGCSCLVRCTLSLENIPPTPDGPDQPPYERIFLPTLRSLTIDASEFSSHCWEEFLRPLEFPALIDLDIDTADDIDEEMLVSFLQKSACSLETLTWAMTTTQDVDSESFCLLLPHLHSIRELTVPQHCLSPAVFVSVRDFQEIRHIDCFVNPPGLCAFVDLLERCMVDRNSHRMESAVLRCWEGIGSNDALKKYEALKPRLEKSGREVQVVKIGMRW